ncbi:hypothetical protein Y1Q_0016879 [Alligator mississippiensis]|uniref:Uncharacterized protein n=1 Tax=Alligator mississippiensis TaxID=8496 RepID=A0A151P6T0_ALLMI|nr:hypothetical protein Y1Q_0016879 [Alligator mississippiensis]
MPSLVKMLYNCAIEDAAAKHSPLLLLLEYITSKFFNWVYSDGHPQIKCKDKRILTEGTGSKENLHNFCPTQSILFGKSIEV